MATQINTKALQAELQVLANPTRVKVKLDRHIDIACSIRETDNGFHIRLNPKRIRTPGKLEEHLDFCREAVGGI